CGFGQGHLGFDAAAIAKRLCRLSGVAQRSTNLPTGPDQLDSGAIQSLRRYGRVVSSARRRLVAPDGTRQTAMKSRFKTMRILIAVQLSGLIFIAACSPKTDVNPQTPSVTASNVKLTPEQRGNVRLYKVAPSTFHKTVETTGVV